MGGGRGLILWPPSCQAIQKKRSFQCGSAHFVLLINLLKKLRQVESRKRHVRVPCSNRPLALALFPKQTCQKSVTPKHGQQRGTTHQGRARHRATKKVIHCLCLSTRKESSERIRKTARNVKKKRETEREAVESQIEMGRCSKSIDGVDQIDSIFPSSSVASG